EFDVVQNTSEPYIELAGIEERLLTSVTRNTTALTLYTNDEWVAESSDETWCTVETPGSAGGRHSVNIVCASNTSHEQRTARVTFRAKNSAGISRSFEVVQSDEFAAPEIVLAKDESGRISLSWDAVMGAVKYMVVLKNGDATIAEIDNGTATGCDLSADKVFAEPEYAGMFSVSVRALSDEPEIFSDSNTAEANSHFASGEGTAESPFVVDAPYCLRNIALVNDIAAGCHYRLDYTPVFGEDFEPICSPATPFKGIFDGNGKTIADWDIRPMADRRNYFGLFGGVDKNAEVSNLRFENCSLYIANDGGSVDKTGNGFAWVAGTNKGTIRNIAVAGCTVACETGTSPLYVGGIAADNSGTVSDCRVSGSFSAASDRNKTDVFDCGGIAAYNTGLIENCVNDAPIAAMNQVGGIVGMNGGSVIGCVNNGDITANYYFGGVVGYTTSSSATCIIERCTNTGTLTMDEPSGMGRGAAYMGGITSRIYSPKTTISKCCNTGDLIVGASASSSALRVGGLVGHTNKAGSLTDSYNTGSATIRCKVNYGGIVGEMASQKALITNCYTVGSATVDDGGSGNVAAAFGKADATAVITCCYALDNGREFALGSTDGIVGGGLLSDSRMQDPASFEGWDFIGTWQQGGGAYPYPVLR
ncbi:MAG: BACON domain-containing protein, partial [Alistipes sp.]|nr:BACON domain-containing protein [Alistipes sp.]